MNEKPKDNTKLEATVDRLEREIKSDIVRSWGERGIRMNLRHTLEPLYANEETGTAAYLVRSSSPIHRWATYYVGDENGWTEGYHRYDSSSYVSYRGVDENEDHVVIRRNGEIDVYDGLMEPVRDIGFRKADFQPYTTNKK